MKVIAIALILTTGFISASAQKPAKNGEGIVIIKAQNASVSPASETEPEKQRYFIKGRKILRKDSVSDQKPKFDSKAIQGKQGQQLSVGAAAVIRYPQYLIDLDKMESAIFYKSKGKRFASLDSLKNNTYELYYRIPLLPNFNQYKIVYDDKSVIDTIVGKKCLAAKVIYNFGDTFSIKYTREPLKIPSPLTNFVRGFPYQVLSIEVKLKSGNSIHTVRYELDTMEIRTLPDALFSIPADVTVRHRVPLHEMGDSW